MKDNKSGEDPKKKKDDLEIPDEEEGNNINNVT